VALVRAVPFVAAFEAKKVKVLQRSASEILEVQLAEQRERRSAQ